MLKTSIRYLWLNKGFTLLNIIGLSIGISACFIIYQLVSFEFSFERNIPAHENIYSVVSHLEFDEQESYNVGIPKPLGRATREEVPGVQLVVPVAQLHMDRVKVRLTGSEQTVFKSPDLLIKTQADYFKMLPYKWLAGNSSLAFNRPENVVLTKSRAEKYFPDIPLSAIIGKNLIYNDTIVKQVSGIVNDLDFATSFYAKEFFPLSSDYFTQSDWGSTNSDDKLYIKLQDNISPAQVQQKIDALSLKNSTELFQKWRFKRDQRIIPIADMHFAIPYGEDNVHKANKPVLLGLIGVAVFLLLLAVINFINLTTAQLPQRAKEIAVRKTMGSPSKQLILQFLGETLIICLLASILSSFLTYLFILSFRDLLPESLYTYTNYYQVGRFFLLFLLGTTLSAGIYPGWLISRVNPIQVLRNQASLTFGGIKLSLRKALIVFQFIIAMLFIVCAIIIGQQLKYTLNKDLGFNKDAVVLVNVPWQKVNDEKGVKFTLLQELKKLKGVDVVALGAPPLSSNFHSDNYDYTAEESSSKKELQLYIKEIDESYLSLYAMKLLAGRDLLETDTVSEYIINETAMHMLGFKMPQEAIGKFIGPQDGKTFPIVGVVRDFHDGTFYKAIDPIIMVSDKKQLATYNVKLRPDHPESWQESVKEMESLWKAFYPEETFEYKFYDSSIQELYTQERNMSKIINLSTTVAILISCLGLLGLITLTAYQRTKEIGIRKVLGASVTAIVQLLSIDFIKLVLLAILIASPVAWWAMNKWLNSFAYKIEIQWWIFALAGLSAIGIAFLTMSIQAIRAARSNPVDSLRNE